jgi:hypothetical protein
MSTSELEQMKQAIYRADELHNPGAIFTFVEESLIWRYARAILDDQEWNFLLAPTLIQGINAIFSTISNQAAVYDLLLHALHFTDTPLNHLYQAAQHTILTHADVWNTKDARHLNRTFEGNYLSTLEEGDQFIAILSLEGAVMLSLLRREDDLVHRALSLLLGDFPPIPDDPGDPAYLPVKALKLLSRCHDYFPADPTIRRKVEQCVGSVNYAVNTEAHFTLGIIALYDAFQASDRSIFLSALQEATAYFSTAARSEENRTDAELFAAIVGCYTLFLTASSPATIVDAVAQAEAILTERLWFFQGRDTPDTFNRELRFVQLLAHLAHWASVLREPTHWPELKPSLLLLADIYTAVRQAEVAHDFMGSVSDITRNYVMLPHLLGRFVQVQEITAKMSSLLSDNTWKEQVTPSQLAFCELVLQVVRDAPPPKAQAATELEHIRVAAEREDPSFARWLTAYQESSEDFSHAFMQLAWRYLERERTLFTEILFTEGPAMVIHKRIVPYLREKLRWDTESLEWQCLDYSIRIVIRYLIRSCRTTPNEASPADVSFLFAEGVRGLKGLGNKAKEVHLENDFRTAVRMADLMGDVERQSISIAPGRPDLNFRFGDITFPIEFKRELRDIGQAHIHESYIAQAQSYAAGSYGVSFLFILDLTPKTSGIPLRNMVEYCYVDHRPVPGSTQNDCVIVVIIPANRLRPSDHSW